MFPKEGGFQSSPEIQTPVMVAGKNKEEIKALFVKNGQPLISDEVLARLSQLDSHFLEKVSHFFDAEDIVKIFEKTAISSKDLGVSLEEFKSCILVHDIGKTGPVGCSEEEQQLFVELFNLNFEKRDYNGKTAQQLTLKEALQIKVAEGQLSTADARKILQTVIEATNRNKTTIKIDEKSLMKDFWSAHVYWTHDLLREQNFSEEIIAITSAHHEIDGHFPNKEKEGKNFLYSKLLLMLLDKFQAFLRRGGKSPAQAIIILREMVNSKLTEEEEKKLALDILGEISKQV